MKRLILILLTVSLAASAGAGTLPDAGDEYIMRLGFFGSGAVHHYSYVLYGLPYSEFYEARGYGAGGGGWAQYDHTWLAYAMSFSVAEFGGGAFRGTFIEWNHEYYLYVGKWRIRPFIEPNGGVGSAGRLGGHLGISGGVRWNMLDSPFYATVSGGYKHSWGADYEEGDWGIGKVSCYLALWDSVALYVAAVAERSSHDYRYEGHQSDGPRWRSRLDVGPSWAF